MNQKDKQFSFKTIDEIYNFVDKESKTKPNGNNVIRPENINVVKDDDSEIVLLMSYKKGNQHGITTQSPRYSDKKGEQQQQQNNEPNRQRLASTIKYLTKGIVSEDNVAKNDSLEQNIRGIFNNSQNPCFKPLTTNIDEIRSTDTLNQNQMRKMNETNKCPNNFDEKVLKPLTTKSQFWDSRQKTKIPQPARLKSRENKSNVPISPLASSPTKSSVQTNSNNIPVKQRYFALCIPDMINNSITTIDKEPHFQTLRYFNPNNEIFRKPNNNELVVVPVNVISKDGIDQSTTFGSDSYSSSEHNAEDKVELTLEELHTIVKLVKGRNII